jgi:cell division protein FtsB
LKKQFSRNLIMGVERKKRMKLMKSNCLNVLWLLIGAIIIGGIYLLSYHNVDEAVVSESKTFFEFVRAVLQ